MSELTGSNHRCRAQFKRAQTVIGQRSAGNGPNGLSYDYYYYLRIGNSKNEIRQRQKVRETMEYGRSTAGTKKRSPRLPNCIAKVYRPQGSILPEAVDELH